MSQLLAFRIEVFDEEDGTAIVVDSTASKARYQIYLHCRELGFRLATTGKPWPGLVDLRVKRAPEFDGLAAAQSKPRHWASNYAEMERARLETACP